MGGFYDYTTGNSWIHSGNISSQSVNYATSAGTANSLNRTSYSASGTTVGAIKAALKASNLPLKNGNWTTVDYWFIGNYGDDSASASGGGLYSITTIGGYQGSDYNQFLVSCHSDMNIGVIGLAGGNWSQLRWLQYSDQKIANASYADSAGSVSWSNVTGKPTILTMGSDGRYSLGAGGSLGGSNGGLNTLLVGDDAWFGDCNVGGIVGVKANNSTSQAGFYFYGSNANLLSTMVATSGAATFSGSVYSNSDRHLKKNISSIPVSSLERLFDISDKLLKKFTWKLTGKESYGFIAQELEKYIPEAVSQDNEGTKSVSYNIAYSKIIASLVNEIKKLKDQVKTLMDDK